MEMRKTQRGGLKEEGTWWRLPPHLHRTLERRRRWRRWRNRSPNDFLHHEKKRLRWATIGMGVYVKPRSIRTHVLLAPSRTPPVRRPARPPPDGSGASEAYGRSARGGADLAYSNLGLTETGGRVGTKWRLRTIFTLLAGFFPTRNYFPKPHRADIDEQTMPSMNNHVCRRIRHCAKTGPGPFPASNARRTRADIAEARRVCKNPFGERFGDAENAAGRA